MADWAEIKAVEYSTASKKIQTISDMILDSKLSRRELEKLVFILQLEQLKRKQEKENKKLIRMEEYKKEQGQENKQGPEQQ